MKLGLIRLVVCTSTLAQGVNLPIRYLIVTGVYQGQDRMLVRDFHNLIGRAGRAGMHTEGSVIFADNAILDNRRHRRQRWRWISAKELLDPGNSEPSASSIADMFQPFVYGKRRDQAIEVEVDTLVELLFADGDETISALAEVAHGEDQNIKPNEYEKFLRARVKIVHGIAAFLLAHLDFAKAAIADDAVDLAKNTLAHFLADENRRVEIESVFRKIAEGILAGAVTEEVRLEMRRSPLPPRSVQVLKQWLEDNAGPIQLAIAADALLALIIPVIIDHNRNATIVPLSDLAVMPAVITEWVKGTTFDSILQILTQNGVRIGGKRRRPTIEDAVSICESGLGYEGAMIVAALADLCEPGSRVESALKLLQRRVKYGLTPTTALAMYEIGFADRELAKRLAVAAPVASNFRAAGAWVRANRNQAMEIVGAFPSYFLHVLDELAELAG